ncbi:MAG: YHYH protein [Hyphomicrobiales bacterium]|nr:YHYH protein [Hyphomicrobiales bacterium]MCP5001155.1 YHYH protein [Hyphomicrobiales bacterium]
MPQILERNFPKSKIFLWSATSILVIAGSAGSALGHDLPLGDGNISSQPKVGFVFSCQQRFNPNAPGARASGDWLGKTTWDPSKKPYVEGSVNWPAEISITRTGEKRIVKSNNLPTHPTGVFPIQRNDPVYKYDRNNGRITAQDILIELPAVPKIAASPSCVAMGMIGFSITNAAMYNALDARGDDAPAHEMQDRCSGHPQQTGQYHYHNMTPCFDDRRSEPGGHSDQIGYALDGFGVFGIFGENGEKLKTADLDACHGHAHTIRWDGERRDLYHYHMTDEYPYSIGCYMGTPVKLPASLSGRPQGQGEGGDRPPRRRQGGQGGQGGPGGGPQQVISTAAAELGVSPQQLRQAVGAPPPDFQRASQMLGIPAATIRQAMQKARRDR